MKMAKEIILRDQGYTQQGGDSFSAGSQLWYVALLRILAATANTDLLYSALNKTFPGAQIVLHAGVHLRKSYSIFY